jgi:hypothetical protein
MMEDEFGGEDMSCDVSVDMSNDISMDANVDFGGDLASTDGVDLTSDIDLDSANDFTLDTEHLIPDTDAIDLNSYGMSARDKIIEAGINGYHNPSYLAQFGEILAPEGMTAEAIQAGINASVEGSKEFMDATIRQHGTSPSVDHNINEINQAIANDTQGAGSLTDNQEIICGETGVSLTDIPVN